MSPATIILYHQCHLSISITAIVVVGITTIHHFLYQFVFIIIIVDTNIGSQLPPLPFSPFYCYHHRLATVDRLLSPQLVSTDITLLHGISITIAINASAAKVPPLHQNNHQLLLLLLPLFTQFFLVILVAPSLLAH